MTAPLVSCVVPVFNAERHLAEALDSIFAQTHRPIEVVVVDDGSTDASAAVAEGYGERVRVIRQANAGPSAARAAGIDAARGELIAFLDADDVWLPEKLALQLGHLTAHPELDGVFCEIENFWEAEVAHEEARWRERGRVVGSYTMAALLARRELFERVPFDPTWRHGDHVDWGLRVRDAGGRVELVPRVLVRRRRHAANMSRTDGEAVFDDYFRLIKDTLDRRRRAPEA